MEDDWSSLLEGERHARIRSPLEAFRAEGSLYFEPDIPPKKLANARASTGIPATERVLALIDCTVFGSAKNAVVFGETTLYIHNSWTVSSDRDRGPHAFDYGAFAKLQLAVSGTEVQFAGGAIDTSGSSFSAKRMLAALVALQRSILFGRVHDERAPQHAVYIPPHRVQRECLDATNELWPCGIATHADASVIALPLALAWSIDIERGVEGAPAITRDFVVAVINKAAPMFGAMELVGFELTTGRRFWTRELAMVNWSRPVAAQGLVLVRGGVYWYGFELEGGAPATIDTARLSRAVRDQLVLADAPIDEPARYAAFPSELAAPTGAETAPPLVAANRAARVYADRLLQEHAPALRVVDRRGMHHLRGDRRGTLRALALTERHLFAGTDERQLWIADLAAEPPAWISTMDVPISITAISVGSDHVVIAGDRRLICYRSS